MSLTRSLDGPDPELLVGVGVLAVWIVLIYLGLTFFWWMRQQNPPSGEPAAR